MKARDIALLIFIGATLVAVIVMWAAGVESCTNALLSVC
jgi:hypothetical protein